MANAAKEFVVIADYTKESDTLGKKWTKGLPIEVIPMAYKAISDQIVKRLGGTPVLRMAKAKAGPVVTDNGNFIIDWNFESKKRSKNEWTDINSTIKMIPGVVETGLFIDMTSKVYFGCQDGSVSTKP